MSPQVFLASRNAKKLAEMQRILAEHVPDVEVLGLDDVAPYDEPAETEPTFDGNALIKAHAGRRGDRAAVARRRQRPVRRRAQRHARRAVGALGRRGQGRRRRNNRLLLAQLADVPDERRAAHFTCAVAFAYPVGAGGVAEHVVHGEMPGRVIREMRGSGGFGYDVLFCADGDDVTHRPSCPVEEKDAISHRGKALRAIAPRGRRRADPALRMSTGSWHGAGAPGETRTHTGTDLNRVPLPLGYGRAGPV